MKSFRNNLTNENGNLLWLPSDFYYDVLKIEFDGRGKSSDDERSDDGAHYIYEKMGNMILVEMNLETDTKFLLQKEILLQKTECKDVTLLDSMIDLRTKLSDNTFCEPTKLLDNDSELLTEKEIDSIIKWCSRNGYPFEIPYKELEKTYKESEKPKKYKLFKIILRDQKSFGFKVGDFLISLNNLYCCYKMYSVLSNEIDSIEEQLFLIDAIEPLRNVELHRITIEECKELFEKQYNKLVMDSYVSTKDGLHIKTKARSLFDAAMYQLALVMYDYEQEIRICKCCGKPFIQKNRRKKYCNGCSPQKNYARKKRAEKRQLTNSKKSKTIQ